MVMPPLSHFIRPTPTSVVSNLPTQWLEDCLAGGTDCLVLIDDNCVPVRVLPLSHLLGITENWISPRTAAQENSSITPSPGFPSEAISEALAGYSSLEITTIAVTVPSETAVQMVAAAPDICWIVLDRQQRYLGLLDKTSLLAMALTQHSGVSPPASADAPADADSVPQTVTLDLEAEHRFAQSNTALLTYLGHELKTPLTSLLGLSSLLRTGRLGDLNARQSRYIGLIQQHCRRLAAWVNTLIDLGRIDSGTLRLIPHIVDLTSVWQGAYRQAALRVGREEQSEIPLPPLLQNYTPAVTLVADPPRLQQMLTCLMQTALARQASVEEETVDSLLILEIWDHWIAVICPEVDEQLGLDQLLWATLTLPFSSRPAAATPISAEAGHWLEWLLVRKLAQLHGGELVLMAHPHYGINPTLLLPTTPAPKTVQSSRYLLFVTTDQGHHIKTVQQQATQLNYWLIVTYQVKDAVEIAAHISLSAILVFIAGPQTVNDLSLLKQALEGTESLVIALVPPEWSALLGSIPADREILWPANSLGRALFHTSPTMPAPSRLTVLYLKMATPEVDLTTSSYGDVLQLPQIFHDFGCRVLEVDDLEQARLLRQVWNPDVAVLDPEIAHPADYLHTLSQIPELTSLPIITLTMAATQAAHEITPLTVFPCLVGETPWDTPEAKDRMAAWLIQVLQVAATHPR